MAEDHYIAQTYLRHFADGDGRLHAFSKASGKYFRPWPKNVCSEWDDDLNPAIPDKPSLLGDYRKMFEPKWNAAVQELQKQNGARDVKLLVALCFAHMMIAVPAWRRVAGSLWEEAHAARLRIKAAILAERGMKDEMLAKGVEMLNDGILKLEADQDSVKAYLTTKLIHYACFAYHADWKFAENPTDTPFLTSDNPVAVQFTDNPGFPVTRFMPITPELGLVIIYDPNDGVPDVLHSKPEEIESLLQEEPRGKIHGMKTPRHIVRALNRLTVQCAEDLVFASSEQEGVIKLVDKYKNFRIEPEFKLWKDSDRSYMHGFTLRVRHRTDQ